MIKTAKSIIELTNNTTESELLSTYILPLSLSSRVFYFGKRKNDETVVKFTKWILESLSSEIKYARTKY